MTEKVLVVEDDNSIATLTRLQLESKGYQVTVAHNGTEGLRLAYSWQPDLVILDIMMPDMDGWTVCQRLREMSDVPIIFVTAVGQERNIVRGLQLGADDLRIVPARVGVAGEFQDDTSKVPFALGLHGPLRFDEATWTLAPAGVAVRRRGDDADDPVPTLDAHGALALGGRLALQLDGVIADWPAAWPALPAPIGQSRSPLPFALRYDGVPAFEDVASLRLQRDATRFDGRFRLPEVLAWLDQADGSPLPPLAGTLATPELEITGARLEGVEIEFDDSDATGASP